MVTVDEYGNIAIWKELNCICAYDKECSVSSVSTASFTIQRKDKNPKSVNLFFIGGKDGKNMILEINLTVLQVQFGMLMTTDAKNSAN